MAKKADKTIEPNPSEVLDMSDLMTGEELSPALSQLFAELGGDATGVKITVYISKLLPETNKEARVWSGPPDEYDLMGTARRFGSGDYRVKVYGPTERGNPGMRVNQVIPILLDPQEDARIVALRKGEPVAPNTLIVGGGTNDTAGIVQSVIAALKSQQVVAPAVDPFTMFERFAGTMAKLLPQQPVHQSGGGMSGLKDVLEMARTIIDIGGGAEGRGERGKPQDYALTRGVDLVAKMFEQHMQSQPRAIPAPAASSKQSNGEAAPQLSEEQQVQLDFIRSQLRMANMAAKTNADPAEFADTAYGMMPEEIIKDWAQNPQWFELLCANLPECKQYKDWYEKVRIEVIAIATEEGVLQQAPDSDTKVDAADPRNGAPAGTDTTK